jgi:hypothetical protein
MEKNILLEILKIRKPPTEFQDACFKKNCAVRATLQLEDFNVEGLTRGQFALCSSFHYQSWFSFSLLKSAQSSFGGRGETKTIQTQQRDFRKKTHRFLISNVFFRLSYWFF